MDHKETIGVKKERIDALYTATGSLAQVYSVNVKEELQEGITHEKSTPDGMSEAITQCDEIDIKEEPMLTNLYGAFKDIRQSYIKEENFKLESSKDSSQHDVLWVEKKVLLCSASVKAREEMQEDVNQEFFEDPLKVETPCVAIKADEKVNVYMEASEHNHLQDPLFLSGSTNYIKEDPELNLEAQEAENNIAARETWIITCTHKDVISLCDREWRKTYIPGHHCSIMMAPAR